MTRDNELAIYSSPQSINSDLAIAFIDDFCESLKHPAVIVLDNATIHHSESFEDKIPEWAEQDLHIFYLPRYSPHLNLIETLWRKIKYEWLKAADYANWQTFSEALDYICAQFGTEFTINFKDQLTENI